MNTSTIALTFTQCKQIVANGFELREVVTELNEIPAWAHLSTVCEIQSIIQCGCAANAHISCFYAQAAAIFNENSADIESTLEQTYEEMVWNIAEETFTQFTSKLLQTAVEHIAYNFSEMLEGVNWD